MILRARTVLPLGRPPFADGAVQLARGRIQAVGRWRDLRAQAIGAVQDLGEVILLPGLVNPHAHLDYTAMAGMIPPPRSFTDWIKSITTLKAEWSYAEYAQSWLRGAEMLRRHGTTTVGDIEALPELLPDVWSATPLRVRSFLEMTGVRSRRDPELILREAIARRDSLPEGRSRAFLSPHAPYSTPPVLLRRVAEVSRQHRWPFSVHVAESAEEFQMFTEACGPMYDWLGRNEREMSDCGSRTPVERLAALQALGPRTIAVHVNYLGPRDIPLLRESGAHVVHCPRSHAYFRHRAFDFAALRSAGLNLSLGTDSLATTRTSSQVPPELSLFAEMQTFARAHPAVAPAEILPLVTVNPAKALGLEDRVGVLREGAWADLITIPYAGRLAESPEAVVHHRGPVRDVWIEGRWTSVTP